MKVFSAIVASRRLAGHGSIAPEITEHGGAELLHKDSCLYISARLDDDSVISAKAATFKDSLQQGLCNDGAIPAMCWRLVAISLQRNIFALDSL